MLPQYSLGISPCPNDTFIFEALINGRLCDTDAPFSLSLHIADVEELNGMAQNAALDITKLSLAAALDALDEYILLSSGAALGRGCGPLVVAMPHVAKKIHGDSAEARAARATARIAIPGSRTTANLLLSLTGLFSGPREEMIFDEVMPAVLEGKADLGVIIHEGRFTYADKGLSLVLDLGAWWEGTYGLPLPLGIIAARRSLGKDAIIQINNAIRASLEQAFANPQAGQAFVRAHAQEMAQSVLDAHIAMFVNSFSLDLGDEGKNAVRALLRAAAENRGKQLPDLPVFI